MSTINQLRIGPFDDILPSMARILIVDDEESILRSIAALLATDGHEVVAKCDGKQAIACLRSETIDLLVTDIRMSPVDGMQLMEIAHKEKPDLPMIVISAYGADSTEAEGFARGCVAYLKKPFKIQECLDAVRNALGDAEK